MRIKHGITHKGKHRENQRKTRQTELQLRKKTLKTGNELLSELIRNHEHIPNRKQGK
jgi:hypothetical protein